MKNIKITKNSNVKYCSGRIQRKVSISFFKFFFKKLESKRKKRFKWNQNVEKLQNEKYKNFEMKNIEITKIGNIKNFRGISQRKIKFFYNSFLNTWIKTKKNVFKKLNQIIQKFRGEKYKNYKMKNIEITKIGNIKIFVA